MILDVYDMIEYLGSNDIDTKVGTLFDIIEAMTEGELIPFLLVDAVGEAAFAPKAPQIFRQLGYDILSNSAINGNDNAAKLIIAAAKQDLPGTDEKSNLAVAALSALNNLSFRSIAEWIRNLRPELVKKLTHHENASIRSHTIKNLGEMALKTLLVVQSTNLKYMPFESQGERTAAMQDCKDHSLEIITAIFDMKFDKDMDVQREVFAMLNTIYDEYNYSCYSNLGREVGYYQSKEAKLFEESNVRILEPIITYLEKRLLPQIITITYSCRSLTDERTAEAITLGSNVIELALKTNKAGGRSVIDSLLTLEHTQTPSMLSFQEIVIQWVENTLQPLLYSTNPSVVYAACEGIVKLLPYDLLSSFTLQYATQAFNSLLNLAVLPYQNVRTQLSGLIVKCIEYIPFKNLYEVKNEDKKVLNNGEIYKPLTRDMGEWIKDASDPTVIKSFDEGISPLDQVVRCIFRIQDTATRVKYLCEFFMKVFQKILNEIDENTDPSEIYDFTNGVWIGNVMKNDDMDNSFKEELVIAMLRTVGFLEPIQIDNEKCKWGILAVHILTITEPCLKWFIDERRTYITEYTDRLSRMCVAFDHTTDDRVSVLWIYLCNILNTILEDIKYIQKESLPRILMILCQHCPSEESVPIICELINEKLQSVYSDYNEYMDEALEYYILCMQYIGIYHPKLSKDVMESLQAASEQLEIGEHMKKEIEMAIEKIGLAVGKKSVNTSLKIPANIPGGIKKKILDSYKNKRAIYTDNDILIKLPGNHTMIHYEEDIKRGFKHFIRYARKTEIKEIDKHYSPLTFPELHQISGVSDPLYITGELRVLDIGSSVVAEFEVCNTTNISLSKLKLNVTCKGCLTLPIDIPTSYEPINPLAPQDTMKWNILLDVSYFGGGEVSLYITYINGEEKILDYKGKVVSGGGDMVVTTKPLKLKVTDLLIIANPNSINGSYRFRELWHYAPYSKHFDCVLTKEMSQENLKKILSEKCEFGLRLNDEVQLCNNYLQYQALCTTRSYDYFVMMITAIHVNLDKENNDEIEWKLKVQIKCEDEELLNAITDTMSDVISSFVGGINVDIKSQYYDGERHQFDKDCVYCYSSPVAGSSGYEFEGNAMFKWSSLKNRRHLSDFSI